MSIIRTLEPELRLDEFFNAFMRTHGSYPNNDIGTSRAYCMFVIKDASTEWFLDIRSIDFYIQQRYLKGCDHELPQM